MDREGHRLDSPSVLSQEAIGKTRRKRNLTGRVQCVQVCVCAVAVDKCKAAATPKDNLVVTFRYCKNSYIAQRYCLWKPYTLLQSWQRVFYYICSLHSSIEFSGKVGRKWQLEGADEEWIIRLLSWRIPYLVIMIHVIPQHLPRKKETQPAWGWQTQSRHCS